MVCIGFRKIDAINELTIKWITHPFHDTTKSLDKPLKHVVIDGLMNNLNRKTSHKDHQLVLTALTTGLLSRQLYQLMPMDCVMLYNVQLTIALYKQSTFGHLCR